MTSLEEDTRFADALNELCEIGFENSDKRGFHQHDFLEDLVSYRSDGNVDEQAFLIWREMKATQRLMLMISEVVEAMEELRAGRRPDETYLGDKGKPEGVPAELADVLIRIFDFCGSYGIDLGAAVVEKMKHNTTRIRMHGKAF